MYKKKDNYKKDNLQNFFIFNTNESYDESFNFLIKFYFIY